MAGRQDPMEKLKAAFDEWQNEREARAAIENDPKKAGAALANDLREFLGEWKAAKAAKSQGGTKAAAKPDDDDNSNILSVLFGG